MKADQNIRKYLAHIGRLGGLKSRRSLDLQTARSMVCVREARRAFRRYYSSCFWSYDPNLIITRKDIPWLINQLIKNGGRSAMVTAMKICR